MTKSIPKWNRIKKSRTGRDFKSSFNVLFYFFYNSFESIWMVHGQISKNLTIQFNAIFVNFTHELRVR
jgi:hypothetical protein